MRTYEAAFKTEAVKLAGETVESEHIDPIMEACRKLKFTAGYRNFFGRHYIIACKETDKYLLKRQDCLLYFLNIAETELREYSENHRWDAPKPGFLSEWAAAAFRYERVKQMLDEIHRYHDGFDVRPYGLIRNLSVA
jgi:hypothetical protein